MLFSEIERSFEGPKTYAEPDYEYLDRSGRQVAICIRRVLEEWVTHSPKPHIDELVSRFQSPINVHHISAAFELCLYELLVRLGYQVVVHPEIKDGKGKRPDFLVTDADGFRFYLEAVVSNETTRDQDSADSRVSVVLDLLNRLESSNFFLGLDHSGSPKTQPSVKQLRMVLEEWLAGLEADTVLAEVRAYGHRSLPTLKWSHDGWKVEFTAIPRSPEKRDTPVKSIIGTLSNGAHFLNTWEAVRDSLLAKGSRYGELDAPLVIAVNACVTHLDEIDVMEALFGQEQFIIQAGNPDVEPRFERVPNGFWNGPNGPQYTRVAAVIIGFDLRPWTFGVRNLRLYKNPWAQNLIKGAIHQLPITEAINGKMESHQGTHLKYLLNLPPCYPGVEE